MSTRALSGANRTGHMSKKSTPTLHNLKTTWKTVQRKPSIQKKGAKPKLDVLRKLLDQCVGAGSYTSDAGERAGLKLLATDIAEDIFQATGQFPQAAIQPLSHGRGAKEASERTGPRVFVERLPMTGATPETFEGRDGQVRELMEAWEKGRPNVLVLVAAAGVGKTALVKHWLSQLQESNYGGANLVFGWSFYTPRTRERVASAAEFFVALAEWLGVEIGSDASPEHHGALLADALACARSLLILDGLEPLQNPPGNDEGRLKDPALSSFLMALAAKAAHQCLCIVTTRVRLADLEGSGSMVEQRKLDYLQSS